MNYQSLELENEWTAKEKNNLVISQEDIFLHKSLSLNKPHSSRLNVK